MRPRSFALALVLACLLAPLAVAAQQPKGKKKEAAKPAAAQPAPVLDSLVIPTAFRARSIGPAVMGGRVSDDRARSHGPVHVLRRRSGPAAS